jgi:hypothetical protein
MIAYPLIAFFVLAPPHQEIESVLAQRLDARKCQSVELRVIHTWHRSTVRPEEYVWTLGCIRACLVGWHRSNWHYQCETWTARPQPVAS